MTITLEFPIQSSMADIKSGVSKEFFPLRRETGLVVVPYENPPMGKNVFTIALDATSEMVRIWPGLAKVTVEDSTAEPKPQMILHAAESGHKVQNKIRINSGQWGFWRWEYANAAPSSDLPAENFVIDSFPDGTKFAWAKNSPWVGTPAKRQPSSHRTEYIAWEREMTISVPKSDMHFLVGYDEQKCFIARLPEAAATVAQAHRILRPKNLTRDAVRQGEWFFDPLTIKGSEQIDARIKSEDISTLNGIHGWRWTRGRGSATLGPNTLWTTCRLENNSTHRAQSVIVLDGVMYAKGKISDSRTSRHHSIILDRWHRVVRNNESHAPLAQGTQRRQVRWD